MRLGSDNDRRVQVFRRWSNYLAGWFTSIWVWVLTVILVDPLHLYSTYSDVPSETLVEALPLFMVVASVITANHLLFVRPNISISPTHVRLRNPLQEYSLPRNQIEEVGENWLSYPRFIVSGKGYVGWGLERTNLEVASGSPGALAEIADQLKDDLPNPSAQHHGQVNSVAAKWASMSRDDYVFALLWGGYLVGSVIARVIGSSPSAFY